MTQKNHTTNLNRIATAMCSAAGSHAEYAGMAVQPAHGGRVSQQLGAGKSERVDSRSGYRCGYRPRRLDTRMGTMYLMVPKVRQGGYIPFFVTERNRSEAALIQVVQEAFVQGVSTRKMERLAQSLGIESLSRSQVSEMTKGLNEQVKHFPQPLSFPKQVSHFVGGRPVRKSSYGRQNCKHGGVCGLWYR